jgi:hypothetical protein
MSQSILAEDCYAECHTLALFAECHHVECCYAECHGVLISSQSRISLDSVGLPMPTTNPFLKLKNLTYLTFTWLCRGTIVLKLIDQGTITEGEGSVQLTSSLL